MQHITILNVSNTDQTDRFYYHSINYPVNSNDGVSQQGNLLQYDAFSNDISASNPKIYNDPFKNKDTSDNEIEACVNELHQQDDPYSTTNGACSICYSEYYNKSN